MFWALAAPRAVPGRGGRPEDSDVMAAPLVWRILVFRIPSRSPGSGGLPLSFLMKQRKEKKQPKFISSYLYSDLYSDIPCALLQFLLRSDPYSLLECGAFITRRSDTIRSLEPSCIRNIGISRRCGT